MADTTITCTVSPCTVVLQLSHPLLDITPEQGAEIAIAVIAVWAVGVVYRLLSWAIKSDGETLTIERE
jgi:hypothetical protein